MLSPHPHDDRLVVSVKLIAATLEVTPRQVHRWMREGLPHSRLGRRAQFHVRTVREWLNHYGQLAVEAPGARSEIAWVVAELQRQAEEIARLQGLVAARQRRSSGPPAPARQLTLVA